MPNFPELSLLTSLGLPGQPQPPQPNFVAVTGNPFFESFSLKPLQGLDSWYVEIENLTAEGSGDSINIPWLLSISLAVGNATTEAIGKNAVVFSEPEWGFDITGTGKGSLYGNGGIGSGEGGLYVSF